MAHNAVDIPRRSYSKTDPRIAYARKPLPIFLTQKNQLFQKVLDPDLSYRADVDGLRAIAVLSVVLYHAGVSAIPGGFVGVDVFFVISGYLITQRLVAGFKRRREGGSFTLREFFTRRIRRLFPAMVSTVILSGIAGAFILSPDAFIDFGYSAIAAAFSSANIYFYFENDYWGPGSDSLVLLHFWSLAVEEQFYLVWPAVILFLSAFSWRKGMVTLAVLFVISLIVTILVTQTDQSAAFYLTPFRAYEFIVGAMCVWFDRSKIGGKHAPAVQVAFFIFGLVLLVFAFLTFSEDQTFPGWKALIPSVATALLILARGGGRSLEWTMTNPVMRHFGLLSYSLYLIHWPVLVYGRMLFTEIQGLVLLASLVLIYVISLAQYKLIETPLRRPLGKNPQPMGSPRAFTRTMIGFGSVSLTLIVLASSIILMNGLPSRIPSDRQQFAAFTREDLARVRYAPVSRRCSAQEVDGVCGRLEADVPNVLVLGDSFAVHGFSVATSAMPDANVLVSTLANCRFVSGPEDDLSQSCAAANALRASWIEANAAQLDGVVIANLHRQGGSQSYADTAAWVSQHVPAVAILGESPRYTQLVPDLLVRYGSDISNFETNAHWREVERMRELLSGAVGISIWSPADILCPEGECQSFNPVTGIPTVSDDSHLSLDAAVRVGAWLRETNTAGEAFEPLIEFRRNSAALPELGTPVSATSFDGTVDSSGRLSESDVEGLTVLTIVLQSSTPVEPEVAFDESNPPMPMRLGSIAMYQIPTGYRLQITADHHLEMDADAVGDSVRVDIRIEGDLTRVYVDDALYETIDGIANFDGRYRIGAGYRERFWAGEISALQLSGEEQVRDFLAMD